MGIHATAVIDPKAEIGTDVDIGPYAIIEDNVQVGDGCSIGPHCHLSGHTTVGKGTRIHAGAVVGDRPQDHNYTGAVTYTDIGDHCTIREYVTIHRGTVEGSRTVVGNHTMLMGFVHLGHNCRIGDQVVIANGSMLAGHVEVGPKAFISAGVLMHQFVRVGRLAMIGGGNGIGQDIPPFCMLQFDQIQGPNVVGLRRAGFDDKTRRAIRGAIRLYFFTGLNRPNALAQIRETVDRCPEVDEFTEFIEATKRGISPGRQTKSRNQGADRGAQSPGTTANARSAQADFFLIPSCLAAPSAGRPDSFGCRGLPRRHSLCFLTGSFRSSVFTIFALPASLFASPLDG